jgi:hemerythrin-like domain-containing protein
MKPVGPLMWEHRLIEQIIPLIVKEIHAIETTRKPDAVFIDKAVDFFRTYADRTHHGKEEDILFQELQKRDLSPELGRIMQELMDEHVIARKNVRMVMDARQEYLDGRDDALGTILAGLTDLSNLYPGHIAKEDKRFFFPVMEYFTPREQEKMLSDFYEFDRKMIHEKYQNLMEQLGAKVKRW